MTRIVMIAFVAFCSPALAAEPVYFTPFPSEKLKEYQSLKWRTNVRYWDRDLNLQISNEAKPHVQCFPGIVVHVKLGESLPEVPDASVPFVVHLMGEGIDNNSSLETLAKLPNLIALSTAQTRMTDDGLKKLARLKNLKYMAVQNTKFSDDGLKSLSSMPQLEGLCIYNREVTDVGMQHLARLTNLRYLALNNCKITAASLPVIAKLKSLTHLNLNDCTGIGRNLSPLVQLRTLTHLNIGNTLADNLSVKSLKGLKSLSELTLNSREFRSDVFKLCQEFPNLTFLGLAPSSVTSNPSAP